MHNLIKEATLVQKL
uniref:Uncharacterized protein n=1 Tax=Megaselia scalaris TaxID=36166 RepID=T1GBC6_MEGSC